jgi:hypothetical protein
MTSSIGKRALVAVAAAALLVAGCSSGTTPDATAPLSTDEAAALYLQAVCPANAIAAAVSERIDGWSAATEELNDADIEVLSAGASGLRMSASVLTSPPQPWPSEVSAGVTEVATEIDLVAESFEQMAEAQSRGAAFELRFVSQRNAGGEADRVRERLGLPPDGPDGGGCPAGSLVQ